MRPTTKRAGVLFVSCVLAIGLWNPYTATADDDLNDDSGVDPGDAEALDEAVPVAHGGDDADVTRGDFLQVYSVNWENLPEGDWLEVPPQPPEGNECDGDWRDLLHYMRFGPEGGPFPKYTPDILLVQQIDGQGELDFLVQEMTEKLDGRYAAVIANRKDHTESVNDYCRSWDGSEDRWVKEKDEQTNAIIYRTGRFEKVVSWGWQSGVWDEAEGHCENNTQDRTRNVAVRLRDRIYGASDRSYYVTAASIHWPTDRHNSWVCAEENWREAYKEMDEPEDDELRIIGGDFNIPDSDSGDHGEWWRKWYQNANGKIPAEDVYDANDYRDVIYQHCSEPGKDRSDCLDSNWTFNSDGPGKTRRIDFLFAQADGGRGSIALPEVHAEHTVTFNEGDSADSHVGDGDDESLSYSQHRAIRARIHYPF